MKKISRRSAAARDLMMEFADQTGLSDSGREPRRYLWTDAFAVCNFLELFRTTGEQEYLNLALRLVDQVHHVLGRRRADDRRQGWISGLDEEEGERHPTVAGLRIGKELNERQPEERFDEQLEWERDGQYYHYLTKWMHALYRVSRITGQSIYNVWARELARTAHARFTYFPPAGGRKRMYWKMSIDLSRPLVPSMGQHDPLDGLVTFSELQRENQDDGSTGPELDDEISDLIGMCEVKGLATEDPLGIGGLLFDALRAAQLMTSEEFAAADLLEGILEAALHGLQAFAVRKPFRLPAEYRLAFRELGLAIGLHAVPMLGDMIEKHPQTFNPKLKPLIKALDGFASWGEEIEGFWLQEQSRTSGSWLEHWKINTVMLATSLVPEGFLTVR